MIIKRMRASFGKLHDTLELHEGMNLLTLPNEAGKSTWSAFLVSMLYGVDTSERANLTNQGLPIKERYRPWDGSAMEGAVDLVWNGREITIERTTARRIPMGEFRAYETQSGIPVTELTGENCGRMLCGVGRGVFERTAFIRQLGLAVSGDAELEKRLSALVSTGEDGAKSYSELENLLKKRKNALNGRAGKIPELTAQLKSVRSDLDELYLMQEEAMRLSAKKEETAKELARLEALQARIARAQQAKKRAGLTELEEKTQEQESLCKRLSQTVAMLPEEAELRDLQRRLDSAQSNLQTAKMEAAFGPSEVEKPSEPPYFAGLNGTQAKEKVSADCKEYERLSAVTPPKKTLPLALSIAALIVGVALCAVGLLTAANAALPIGGAALALVGIVGIIATLAVCGKKNAEIRERLHQAELIPMRYGMQSCEMLPQLAQRYADTLEAYQQRVLEYQNEKHRLAEAFESAQVQVNECICAIRAFAPDGFDAESCREALCAGLRAYERLDGEQRSLEAMRQQCCSMRVILGDESAEEDAEALKLDAAKIAYEYRMAKERFAEYSTRLAARQGAISMKGERVELEARLEALTESLNTAQEQLDAIELAMEALKRADETLRSRFSPQITAEAGELLAKLTDGKYPNVLLEPDMRLSVREERGMVMRPAAAMSCGTADQMYLALRLAMVHRLLPEDAPLILDDALVNFDDDRAASAIRLLTAEAEKRQVILFTCRKFSFGDGYVF